MISRVDLHLHSTASDGRLRPAEVVALARQRGLAVIALTDHDSTAGYGEARAAAEGGGRLEVLSGVEINVEEARGEFHLLGYLFDPNDEAFQAGLAYLRAARLTRAQKIVEKLRALGVPLEWERVLAQAGGGAVGRPHVARALVEARCVADANAAFDLYVGRGRPAFVPRFSFSSAQAIELIHAAGGIVSLAHPLRLGGEALAGLAQTGLDGLEVYYPGHSPEDMARLCQLAAQFNLAPTGGSDFHGIGPDGSVSIGSVAMPEDVVGRAKERARARSAMEG